MPDKQTLSDQSVIERARYTALKGAEDRRLSDGQMIDVALRELLDHLIDGYAKSAYEPGAAPGVTDLCELRRHLEPVE